MGNLFIKMLLLVPLLSISFGYVNTSAKAQNHGERPLHDEVPKTDQCSLITIQIRQLAFELKKDVKEMSLLEQSLHASPGNNAYGEQQNEYEQRLKMLEGEMTSLREQINMKEQQLEACFQNRNKSAEQ